MEQELPVARRLVVRDVPLVVGRDVRADQPDLVAAHVRVGLRERDAALAERLDLRARRARCRPRTGPAAGSRGGHDGSRRSAWFRWGGPCRECRAGPPRAGFRRAAARAPRPAHQRESGGQQHPHREPEDRQPPSRSAGSAPRSRAGARSSRATRAAPVRGTAASPTAKKKPASNSSATTKKPSPRKLAASAAPLSSGRSSPSLASAAAGRAFPTPG